MGEEGDKAHRQAEAVDLGKSCRIVLDPVTREVRATCPSEILETAIAIKPRRITFELEEERNNELPSETRE